MVFGLALLAVESETYSLILIKKIFYANPPAPSTSFVAKGRHLHFKCSSKRPGLKMNEIPPEWKEVMDPQTGKPYWYNPTTLQTSWEPPVPATIDPKKVAPFSAEAAASTFEMMGKFTEKLSEYKACADPVQKRALRLEILSIYTEFAVPALSLAVGTFITFPGAFVFFFIALQASGRGLADIQTLAAPVPFAADALSHVDPALGNAAIARSLSSALWPSRAPSRPACVRVFRAGASTLTASPAGSTPSPAARTPTCSRVPTKRPELGRNLRWPAAAAAGGWQSARRRALGPAPWQVCRAAIR